MKHKSDKCDEHRKEAKEQEARVRDFKEKTGMEMEDEPEIVYEIDTSENGKKGEKKTKLRSKPEKRFKCQWDNEL